MLCPRAPSSGSPLLGAELSSAARGRGEGKDAEAVPGGTLADISYLKTPKLSLTHFCSLWRGLLTCSLLPELGRAFRIPCNSWLTLDTSLRGPAIPDVLAASSHFWALTGLLWLHFIPESCFLTTKISVSWPETLWTSEEEILLRSHFDLMWNYIIDLRFGRDFWMALMLVQVKRNIIKSLSSKIECMTSRRISFESMPLSQQNQVETLNVKRAQLTIRSG